MKPICSFLKKALYNNTYTQRYLTDTFFRVRSGLAISLLVNLLYGIFKLLFGIIYSSFWFGSVAVYYILLCIIRIFLLYYVPTKDTHYDISTEWTVYKATGVFLFILNTSISIITVQMVLNGESYQYPGVLIYGMATYAFYNITISIINIIKYRKLQSPVLSAAKILNLTTATVSIFSLQTAMLIAFDKDRVIAHTMNVLTGSVVCTLVLGISIYMIAGTKKYEKSF